MWNGRLTDLISRPDKSSKAYSFHSLYSQKKRCSEEEKWLKMVRLFFVDHFTQMTVASVMWVKAIASPFGRQEFAQQTSEITRISGTFHWETGLLADPRLNKMEEG